MGCVLLRWVWFCSFESGVRILSKVRMLGIFKVRLRVSSKLRLLGIFKVRLRIPSEARTLSRLREVIKQSFYILGAVLRYIKGVMVLFI